MKENKPYPIFEEEDGSCLTDIEEEIAAVERGETVSMSEFKNMFSRWL